MPDLTKGRVQLRARDICLDAHAVPPLGAGDYVQIEVQDNGCGIPAAQIDKIFDPFYSTKNPGMGLDLATVRTIMLEHGGQITVASTGGAGTTITLHFPRTARPASVMAHRPHPRPRR
jgi:two-component system cell cycle sensor histidine kinase/response regulator CckA